MTDQELRDLVAENSKAIKEMREELRESQARVDRQIELTNKQIKQTNKQLGELGRKMGRYTEGLAEQSLYRIFRKNFNLEFAAPLVRRARNGSTIELDFFGYSNSKENKVFVAEIKSSFGEEEFEDVMRMLENFPKFCPEHADKELYGIVAAVNIPENMRRKLWNNGIYLAVLGDEVFNLKIPPDFKPKQFNPNLN